MYPRKYLNLFYNSYAKAIISYGLLAYGATKKASLEPIEKTQWRIFRAMFFKNQSDSLLYLMEENHLQTRFEFYIDELLHELINEIRGNSPFSFLKSFFVPAKVNTRNKEKGLDTISLHPYKTLSKIFEIIKFKTPYLVKRKQFATRKYRKNE